MGIQVYRSSALRTFVLSQLRAQVLLKSGLLTHGFFASALWPQKHIALAGILTGGTAAPVHGSGLATVIGDGASVPWHIAKDRSMANFNIHADCWSV